VQALECAPYQRVKNLDELSTCWGPHNLKAIAGMHGKLAANGIGAGSDLYARRTGQFIEGVSRYQQALLNYRKVVKNGTAAEARRAKDAVLSTHRALNSGFRAEMATNARRAKSRGARKDTPLTSVKRGLNIARDSRDDAKLYITDDYEVTKLLHFFRYARYLGNGIAVIDFGSSIGSIRNTYKAGGNWERDMFIESSSFVASAVAADAASYAAAEALGLVLMATPVGWVGLVVGGIAVLGATAFAVGVGNLTRHNAGAWYDKIMAEIDSL
jgi:hypothetical protein